MKRVLKDYFSFSKKERTAVIILLLLASLFVALPYFFPVKREIPVTDPAVAAFIRDKQPYAGRSRAGNETTAEVSVPAVLFEFDPNTLAADGWVRLGLTPKTATTIVNYRNKGGKFRSPEDIRKIWGLSTTVAERLIPYIVIKHPSYPKDQPVTHLNKLPVIIDINTATTDQWKAMPGIGDVLANRIVSYREKTGGFWGIAQVKKVYGISDTVFAMIQPFLLANAANFPKLDLNTVNQYILAERTGIPAVVAKGIIVYRQQYGLFKTIEDLRSVVFINDSLYGLIQPHVTIKP